MRVLDGSTASTATLLPGVDEVHAERLDERGLPRARRAGDADAYRVPGRGHELVEQRDRVRPMIGAGRLDERDRPRERPPIAGAHRVGELADFAHRRRRHAA